MDQTNVESSVSTFNVNSFINLISNHCTVGHSKLHIGCHLNSPGAGG